jgi:hypothetical protein
MSISDSEFARVGGDANLHVLLPCAASWFCLPSMCMRDSDGDGKGYLELDG